MLSSKQWNHQVKHSSRLQNPMDFSEAHFGTSHMLQHIHTERGVKRLICKWKCLEIRKRVKSPVMQSLANGGIDPHIVSAEKERTVPTIARTRIQDSVT
jgi:hypothetical protein